MNRSISFIGVLLILTSIIFGAFGAHALKEVMSIEQLSTFEVGVRYQMYHGLGLLLLGLNDDRMKFKLGWIIRMLIAGVLFFSGSIYLLSMQGIMGLELGFLGPITPIGGLLMITGWAILAVRLLQQANN